MKTLANEDVAASVFYGLIVIFYLFAVTVTWSILKNRDLRRENAALRERIDSLTNAANASADEPVGKTAQLSDWQVLEMAIMLTESQFNCEAVGKNDDLGVMQLTPVYVREVNRLAGTDYRHEDAYSIEKSLEMFGLMQNHYNPTRDIESGIYYHNKAAWYRKKVLRNMEAIRRAEVARNEIMGRK